MYFALFQNAESYSVVVSGVRPGYAGLQRFFDAIASIKFKWGLETKAPITTTPRTTKTTTTRSTTTIKPTTARPTTTTTPKISTFLYMEQLIASFKKMLQELLNGKTSTTTTTTTSTTSTTLRPSSSSDEWVKNIFNLFSKIFKFFVSQNNLNKILNFNNRLKYFFTLKKNFFLFSQLWSTSNWILEFS